MNPRQRRAILLLGLSAVGLIGVFVLVAGYVSDVRREVEPKITLLQLNRDAAPYRQITEDMLDPVEVPEVWAPPAAIRDLSTVVNLIPTTKLAKGSLLQDGMLVAPPDLEGGQREIAILVDAETGVAGKIRPGYNVDIIATFPGNEDTGTRARARIVVPAARIIDVGTPQARGGDVQQANQDPGQVVPVTFALSVREQLKVTYAETNAQEVRLGLQRPDEIDKIPPAKQRVYAPKEP